MTIDRRTLEGIEACRPGSDDLQSPQLADVARVLENDPEAQAAYQRVQAWDAAIGGAMEQVPVPAGLAERILARLHAEPVVPLSDRRPASRRQGWSRRRWLAASSAIAAAVLVATFASQYLRPSVDTPVEAMAEAWLAGLGTQWRDLDQAPEGFEIPRVILAEANGWQPVAKVSGGRGVVYTLSHGPAGTAKLFVIRLAVAGLPASPPGTPQSNTGGRTIGYWRSGANTYVLVVEGNERTYRSFVNSSRTPVA